MPERTGQPSRTTLRDLAELLSEPRALPVLAESGKTVAYIRPLGPFDEKQIDQHEYLLDFQVELASGGGGKTADGPVAFYPIDVTRSLPEQIKALHVHVLGSLDVVRDGGRPPSSYSASSPLIPDSDLEWF